MSLRWVVVIVLSVLAKPCFAHTLAQTTTQMIWQPDTKLLQVTHALHLDDVLVLMADLGNPEGEMTVEMQAKLMYYLESKFQVKVGDELLTLEPLGAQLDGDFLWLYQEVELTTPEPGISVDIRLLHEYYPQQSHHLNFQIGTDTRSLFLGIDQPSGRF
ncbi:MAG: DUF6702 family protein [Pseudomonadota bacterium]